MGVVGRCTAAARIMTSDLAAAGIVDRHCGLYAFLDARRRSGRRRSASTTSRRTIRSRPRTSSTCRPSACRPRACRQPLMDVLFWPAAGDGVRGVAPAPAPRRCTAGGVRGGRRSPPRSHFLTRALNGRSAGGARGAGAAVDARGGGSGVFFTNSGGSSCITSRFNIRFSIF